MVYWPNFFRSLLFTSKVNLHSKGLSKFAQKVTEVVSTKATYKLSNHGKVSPFHRLSTSPTLYYVPYHPTNKCRKRQNSFFTYKFLNFPSPKFMILAVEELRKALGTPYWVDMCHRSTLIMFYNRYLYVGSLQMSTLESSGRLSCWAILRGSGRCQTQNLATKLLHMVY